MKEVIYNKTCSVCTAGFTSVSARAKYCSDKCRNPEKECEVCKKIFQPSSKSTGRFCSSACWYKKYDEVGREWKSVMPEPLNKPRLPKDDEVLAPENCIELIKNFKEWSVTPENIPFYVNKNSSVLTGYWRQCRGCTECFPTIPAHGQKFCTPKCYYKYNQGENHSNWSGGEKITGAGYRRITVRDKGRIFEHRHIIEEHLGRELKSYENIHHKNGDRLDNRLSNLEVWSTAQPCGQRLEDKLTWAIQLITEYSDMISEDDKKILLKNLK